MKQVLILGNGISRKKIRSEIQKWKFDLWACNWAYKEAVQYDIDRIYSVHSEVIEEAFKFRRNYKLSYSIHSNKGVDKKWVDEYFKKSLGWSTGNLAIVDALEENYDRILLAGFDFGGSDIYQDHILPGGNFFKQFTDILKTYGQDKIFFIRDTGILSVDQMKKSKANSFWATMDKKTANPNKRIPTFSPSSVQKNGKTIIIGNSPDVLEENLGRIIDSFDTIIRVNDFTLKGYEKQLGTRTDIWFTGASKVARKRTDYDMTNTIPILGLSSSRLHLNENDKTRHILIKDISSTFEVALSKFRIIPFDVTAQLKSKWGLNSPTTGFLALYYFIEVLKFSNVTIHGFDFFDSPFHYYDEDKKMKTTLSVAHEYEKEKKYTQKWIESSRIKTLDSFCFTSSVSRPVKNIFLFGTSEFIDEVDIDKIEELKKKKDVVTAGVNRIFRKFQPDYFFFMDRDIVEELHDEQVFRNKNSKWMTSKFLYENSISKLEEHEFSDYLADQEIDILDIDFVKKVRRKSSLLWLIYYMRHYAFPDHVCKFYFVGVSLDYQSSHYYGGMMNKNRPLDTLKVQYQSQFQGLKEFQRSGYHFYSLTPQSKINSFIPFINVSPSDLLEKMPNL